MGTKTNILQKILSVQQKKKSHTSLERHKGKWKNFHFWMNCPFKWKLCGATEGKSEYLEIVQIPRSSDNRPLGEALRFLNKYFPKGQRTNTSFWLANRCAEIFQPYPWQVLKNTSVSHMVKYLNCTSLQSFKWWKRFAQERKLLYALAIWNIICAYWNLGRPRTECLKSGIHTCPAGDIKEGYMLEEKWHVRIRSYK